MLKGMQFVVIHVPEVPAVEDFYINTLGLTVADRNPGFLQLAPDGGATVALGQAPGRDHIELWWYVDDAEATLATLRARGVEIAQPIADMPFGRTFAIKDPAGTTLYLLQPAEPN
jgi:predicted enzyme related to lactoylglutathione lyase